MAKPTNTPGSQTNAPSRQAPAATPDDPQVNANDPGGAHSKGYSAEPGPEPPVQEGPVPLVPDADVHAHAEKPDQSGAVKPAAPRGYTPNDRLMGADR